MTNADTSYDAKLVVGLFDYLKRAPLYTKEMKSKFSAMVTGVCGNNLDDDDFVDYLCKKLCKRKTTLCNILKDIDLRGNKQLPVEKEQIIYDMWHEFSIVTVDRRNMRDVVSVKANKSEVLKYNHLKTPENIVVEKYISKRKQEKLKSTRYISTKTVRELQHIVEHKHGFRVSIGKIFNLRPFYVVPPSEREKESCLCKFCLNLRLKFKELMKHLKDSSKKVQSMSEYFGNGITCNPDENGFYKLECISTECVKCKTTPMFSNDDFKIPEIVHYAQFENREYTYTTRAGKEKTGKRTSRFQKTDSFADFKASVDTQGTAYLLHRFECKNDAYVWPQILADSPNFVFHLDYSENISVSPKFEPQDAHFSSKQTSLHCAVVHYPYAIGVHYVYHIFDDKKHDFASTKVIVKDLISKFNIDEESIIRIKSDNCGYQYCSLHVFQAYQQLSKELGKTILLYYGVNGHGRGLVDAMSGFGVKTPLKRAIITNDFIFNSAEELQQFLEYQFSNDESKLYIHICDEDLETVRIGKGDGVPIAGCLKSRMISIFPNGDWDIKRHMCNCEHCFVAKFKNCVKNNSIVLDELPEELIELDEVQTNDMHIFIEEGSYVGVYSPGKSLELFYVVKIIEKAVASEDICDVYGHLISKNEMYLKGYYLEKTKESLSSNKVFYKLHNKIVFIYPAEIFCPAVAISKELTLSISDYLFLVDSLSRHT